MADSEQAQHLTGMLLVAMPTMADPRFARSVIYLCAHSPEGAMGLVVNQAAETVTFPAVIDQLGITPTTDCADTPVHVGGPVEASRGFVLHSPDYVLQSTLVIDENFALTATVDVLRAIADGKGPKRRVLALGYAGWGAGQLDGELGGDDWIVADFTPDDAFTDDPDGLWARVLGRKGGAYALLARMPPDPSVN
jgi:putative transcriptional regulator